MDQARPDGERPGEPAAPVTSTDQQVTEPLHALFYRRVAGDDALLQLAGLRFAQTGLAAETYADSPGELEHVLQFVPPHPRLPTVHLNRGINLLNEQSRATVMEFATRFAGRVGGLVVHDQRDMGDQTDRLLTVLRDLNARLCELQGAPLVFLEYAAHLEPAWFVELAEKLQDAERVSVCIDIGHLGLKQASARFARRYPGLSLRDLSTGDARLPELAAYVQDAVGGAVGDVIDVIRSIGRLGKRLHFHLHDAHPLIQGLADHFSFLIRLPIPFSYQGRRSLTMMYGPGGLAAILSAAIEAGGLQQVSFTLEIHQVEGRLPLGDASPLFTHWSDTTNAERMNYWLSVLSENALLASQTIAELTEPAETPMS
jgi:sugar phosphate isomerase/epimerase